MEDHLVLTANGPWYEFFYNLAFLAGLAVLIIEAYNRKIPMLKWVILLIITRIMFIAGTKMIAFGYDDWVELLTRFRWPDVAGKSLLGGLLFGIAAWMGGSFLLRFRNNTADAFAVALPLGITIQRLGCFFTGCCFGKPCSLPWAVQYPVNTLPHYHQFSAGMIGHTDYVSLPVHPVQLYEAGGLVAVVGLLLFLRYRFKKPGSLFMLSFILMFAVRFVSEFFRDVNAHVIGGSMAGVFNVTQLVLLPLMIVLLAWLYVREKPVLSKTLMAGENDLLPAQAILVLAFLAVIFVAVKNGFDMTGRTVMALTFAVAFAFPLWKLLLRYVQNPYRWLYPAALILPFFLLSQTYKENVQDSLIVKKYKTLKVGFGKGDFINSHTISAGEGCDSYHNTRYFQQEYKLGAASFELSQEIPAQMRKFSYGAKVVFGKQTETLVEQSGQENFRLVDVSPYLNYERNWMGAGAGLHFGSLNFITEDLNESGTGVAETGNVSTAVYPQVYLRFGPRRWLFADYHLADHFPSALPGFRHQLGVGTGLGMSNFASLRVGSNLGSMTYISGYFPINRFVVEPFLLRGESPWNYNDSHYQFTLGLGYRFGMKEEIRPKP